MLNYCAIVHWGLACGLVIGLGDFLNLVNFFVLFGYGLGLVFKLLGMSVNVYLFDIQSVVEALVDSD